MLTFYLYISMISIFIQLYIFKMQPFLQVNYNSFISLLYIIMAYEYDTRYLFILE